jgi:methyltransferase (TIGR00027 family)
MGVLADPYAARMLTPPLATIVALVNRLPYGVRARSVTLAGLAARVSWFDSQVEKALAAGVEQIVVIGAGYDSRAWRFRRDGVQFFELDHASTQQDKMRRATGLGPTYVQADLCAQSAADALSAGGLDKSRATHFVVEGVTMYLDEDVVRYQLGELLRSAAVGSRLTVDFYPGPNAGTSRNRRQLRLQRLARVGSGEGFRLTVDRVEAVRLVEASGWEVTEDVGLREAAGTLVGRGGGLPIDAVNEQKTLVVAVRR